MTLQELRDEIDLQLASIQQSASVLKSDEVVDDGQCDAVVTCARNIAEAFNKYLASGKSKGNREGVESLEPVAELEPSPYQED